MVGDATFLGSGTATTSLYLKHIYSIKRYIIGLMENLILDSTSDINRCKCNLWIRRHRRSGVRGTIMKHQRVMKQNIIAHKTANQKKKERN